MDLTMEELINLLGSRLNDLKRNGVNYMEELLLGDFVEELESDFKKDYENIKSICELILEKGREIQNKKDQN